VSRVRGAELNSRLFSRKATSNLATAEHSSVLKYMCYKSSRRSIRVGLHTRPKIAYMYNVLALEFVAINPGHYSASEMWLHNPEGYTRLSYMLYRKKKAVLSSVDM